MQVSQPIGVPSQSTAVQASRALILAGAGVATAQWECMAGPATAQRECLQHLGVGGLWRTRKMTITIKAALSCEAVLPESNEIVKKRSTRTWLLENPWKV